MKEMNVAIIGYKFMGKAHSNAWKNVINFFDLPYKPVLKVACGRNQEAVQAFADNWGWEEVETDWQKVVEREDIDIIDISAPPSLHKEIAIAAAKAGKHIFCEKPIALSADEALEMYEAAEEAGVVHYLNHNYRRSPAVVLAKQMIDEGKLGQIYHWRGCYLQSWLMDPNFPLTWHLQKEIAGSGANGGINSHSVDLARYLVGEIKSVTGMAKTFVKERPLPEGTGGGTFSAGGTADKMGKVTVEDAISMVVEFENGALGSFEATTFAIGRLNYNYFEIYGSKGAVIWNLERMNELQYFDGSDETGKQGFQTILATDPSHPYMSHWWPPAHNIGYEHAFHHGVADFLGAIANGEKIAPNFYDGYLGMKVLEAGLKSAETKQQVDVA
ncbi:MAG: Gfo/Idh/MocA family oxidoreductase [Anaerolineales bacterium]|nr:Gfo/Idh/MocA family oxidoreductase [Anaerolineales bacterium]